MRGIDQILEDDGFLPQIPPLCWCSMIWRMKFCTSRKAAALFTRGAHHKPSKLYFYLKTLPSRKVPCGASRLTDRTSSCWSLQAVPGKQNTWESIRSFATRGDPRKSNQGILWICCHWTTIINTRCTTSSITYFWRQDFLSKNGTRHDNIFLRFSLLLNFGQRCAFFESTTKA